MAAAQRSHHGIRHRSLLATILAGLVFLTACSDSEPDRPTSEVVQDQESVSIAEPASAFTDQGVDADIAFMKPKGKPRQIEFTTDEGTEMSIDISPDGTWMVFDLLGHVYRMPIEGGKAVSLTQGSGIALNFHPSISPDGKQIAFVSDRTGQNNIWVMNADGSEPRALHVDKETRFLAPTWTPDGNNVVAVRAFRSPGRAWHRRVTTLWTLPLDGSEPEQLLGERFLNYYAPHYSDDGAYLYFHTAYAARRALPLEQVGHRLHRMQVATGDIENLRPRDDDGKNTVDQESGDSWDLTFAKADDPHPAEMTPVVSPDGKWVIFALETFGEPTRFRNHAFDPGTALLLRNLETGEERRLVDQITKDLTAVHAIYSYRHVPRHDWSPDGRHVYFTQDGKIRRVAVADGTVDTIAFSAPVKRAISEQVRGRIDFENTVKVEFIQWPSGSPDGSRLAFAAVGKIWVMDLPDGKPKPLIADVGEDYQFTPAWSPDGSEIVFTAWNDRERGHVYKVNASGGIPQQLTVMAGEYLFPAWSPDGSTIAVVKGPGPEAAPHSGGWNGWDAPDGWVAALLPASGGNITPVAETRALLPIGYVADGTLMVQYQDNPLAAMGLYAPFPEQSALDQVVEVRAIAGPGAEPETRYTFPAQMTARAGNDPMLSPDNRWIVFQAARQVYLKNTASISGPREQVVTDPNVEDEGRVRIDKMGGIYARWRDSETLEYASGSRYVTMNVVNGERIEVDIDLELPRDIPSGSIALTGAKIITVEGDQVIDKGDIVVDGARIRCVGKCDTAGVDRTIDISGKVIIPGLWDMHNHSTNEPSGIVTQHRHGSLANLAYGITSIMDPATASRTAFPLAELTAVGRHLGPHVYSTAEIVFMQSTGMGDNVEVESYEDALFNVKHRADWGAKSIKNYRKGRRWQHQQLIKAAQDVGVTMTSEGGPMMFTLGLTMDGQTGFEHGIANLPLYSDVTRFLGKANIVYSPTALIFGHLWGSHNYFRPRSDLMENEKYLRFTSKNVLQAKFARGELGPKDRFSFPIVAEGMADIVRAGGHGALGEHGEQAGIGSHWEIWAYAEGLTPMEALKVATWDGAYFVGMHHESGSIKAGKVADLLILNADPLEDIRNTADIAFVMQAGNLYNDDTLDRLWPEKRPLGPLPWN